jgi:hypothetical protein
MAISGFSTDTEPKAPAGRPRAMQWQCERAWSQFFSRTALRWFALLFTTSTHSRVADIKKRELLTISRRWRDPKGLVTGHFDVSRILATWKSPLGGEQSLGNHDEIRALLCRGSYW